MKKRMLSLSLMLLLIGGTVLPAQAETFSGGNDWHVEFTEEKEMVSNFKSSDMDESIGDLQPGDDVVFTITLQNNNSVTTDWWMANEVLKSLEDNSANSATAGGAYGYLLQYTDKTGEVSTLYDSERLGGDDSSPAGVGLNAATDALEEFFYLDTLVTGQSGTITLRVSLDGETQGNDYQDTLANLQMNFAVELNPNGNLSRRLVETSNITRLSDIVKTDDLTNLTPYYIAMGVSGVLILILAVCSMKKSRKEKKEAR